MQEPYLAKALVNNSQIILGANMLIEATNVTFNPFNLTVQNN